MKIRRTGFPRGDFPVGISPWGFPRGDFPVGISPWGFPRGDFPGISRDFKRFSGILKISKVKRFEGISMDFQGFQGIPRDFKGYRGILGLSIDFQRF